MIATSSMNKVTATCVDGVTRLIGWTQVLGSGSYLGFLATASGPVAVNTADDSNISQATSSVMDAASKAGIIF